MPFFPTNKYLAKNYDMTKMYGNQQRYAKQVELIIAEVVAKLRDAAGQKQNFKDLLLEDVLPFLAKKRGSIAHAANNPKANEFGTFRASGLYTNLYGRYAEYHQKTIKLIEPMLQKMYLPKQKFLEGEFHGVSTYLKIEIIDEDEIFQWKSEKNYLRLCALVNVIGKICYDTGMPVCDWKVFQEKELNKLMKVSLKDHMQFSKFAKIPGYKSPHASLLSLFEDQFVIVTRYMSDGLLDTPLSTFYLWMSKNYISPRDAFFAKLCCRKKRSVLEANELSLTPIQLNHQAVIDIKFSLLDVADDFSNIMTTTYADDQKDLLVSAMTILIYRISNATPYERGSAAIIEWLEVAIYKFHGYELEYSAEKNTNLESLTLSLKEFATVYPTCMQLNKDAPLRSLRC
jgi:hypothetical protein